MKAFLRCLTLISVGVILYLLLIPATMEQRGGFYIGGEAAFVIMPLLVDYGINQLKDIWQELRESQRDNVRKENE